ncbi:MAG: hypothetical protein ACK5NQ_07465 [Pseudomonas sp.]
MITLREVPSEHHIQRLLEKPAALHLSPARSQLAGWLSANSINDPVISEKGAALLLASLAGGCEPVMQDSPLSLATIHAYVERHLGHPFEVRGLRGNAAGDETATGAPNF